MTTLTETLELSPRTVVTRLYVGQDVISYGEVLYTVSNDEALVELLIDTLDARW